MWMCRQCVNFDILYYSVRYIAILVCLMLKRWCGMISSSSGIRFTRFCEEEYVVFSVV
ncbi:hypothetical protein ACS0TY_014619 [Phlomoides rotata]